MVRFRHAVGGNPLRVISIFIKEFLDLKPGFVTHLETRRSGRLAHLWDSPEEK